MPSVGIETRILEALNVRLAALTFSPPIPITWPNEPSKTGLPYLAPWLLPAHANAMTLSIAGPNDYGGIYQVSVFWQIRGGATAAMEVASAIATHFKRGTKLSQDGINVRIDDPPVVERALQEPDRLHVPVSVPYRAWVPNP